jgi:hypothetical protein
MRGFNGERMKRFILKFLPILLAFLLGISAKAAWDRREQIHNACANLFAYYQD